MKGKVATMSIATPSQTRDTAGIVFSVMPTSVGVAVVALLNASPLACLMLWVALATM